MAAFTPLIVVAGGGPAAIEALLAVRALAGERVRLELIAPDTELIVRAYEILAPFREGHEHRYRLAPIAADLGVRFTRDAVAAVDPQARTVTLRSGEQRSYEELVVAVGGRHVDAVAGAVPFRGARDASRLKTLLAESRSGHHRSVAFVVPGGHTWPLPMYELALHTSAWLAERGVGGVPLMLVSPEREPLSAFGSRASKEVAALVRSHGIEFISARPIRLDAGRLLLTGARELSVEVAIALPRLEGPTIRGLPSDREGFLPVDPCGRVRNARHVFAAGDATTFPVKQGGLATQQADAIAQQLAADAGASVQPELPRPVLRAVLFAGRERRYLQAELGDRLEETSRASAAPLWPEPGKLIGRYLAPYLESLDDRP
jgi:sulfide:quinone oxidoreductase